MHSRPVEREYYVHNLEHGAIVLAYKCDPGSLDCASILEGFQKVIAGVPPDPLCTSTTRSVAARLVVTPDPALDVPVAVMAWGASLKASCVDVDAVAAFVLKNYGEGPESTCEDGDVLP